MQASRAGLFGSCRAIKSAKNEWFLGVVSETGLRIVGGNGGTTDVCVFKKLADHPGRPKSKGE